MHSCVRFFGDVSASNVTQMGVCPPPPHAAFQFFHFHSQCNFFNFTVSIVGVECLFVVVPPPPPSLPHVSLQGLVGECDEGIGRD